MKSPVGKKRVGWFLAVLAGFAALGGAASASDHLDSPIVVANPAADIGDIYAWTSPSGDKLNLVMAIVGHQLSEDIAYVFHIDSGSRFGRTTATIAITCRFRSASDVACRLGGVDAARGDPNDPRGVEGQRGRFRVFAGLRDDPFFNNVRGTRAAYMVADRALRSGAPQDAARCPMFDAATARSIRSEWGRTNGGPASNFLAGWTPASLVISVDLSAVNRGGPLLAVWGATVARARQVDRAGRPLTGNALLGTLANADVSNALKEAYNATTPSRSARFIPEIETALGLYDGFDGICGNQIFAASSASPLRYQVLARLLADDRLWVNSASTTCEHFFAVELASVGGESALARDCGGRRPQEDAIDVYRSELVMGLPTGIDDGVDRDDHTHSASQFPFLAPPDRAEGAAR